MGATLVQSKSFAQDSPIATVTVSWDTPATAGNLLVIIAGTDDYVTAPNRPAGFTQSTGCGQETNLGHYVWWKVASGGETSAQYTINSSVRSAWITAEISGLASSPYDISNGQSVFTSGTSYTTPSITPSSGTRYMIASIGGARNGVTKVTLSTWLNSFTERQDVGTFDAGGSSLDDVGYADRIVTADGGTSYSSGATYSLTVDTRSGIIIAFKEPAAASLPYILVAN